MKAAIEATCIRNKEMSSYKASRVLNLSQTILQGRKQVFSCEGENDLAEHCLLMERKFLGLTMANVVCLAHQLAVRNGIENQICTRNEKAGSKWLKKFLRRHQEISVTVPEVLHSQGREVSLLNQ
jgi:hypothetical protein